ncbi:MAG: ABC transporter permease [Candidatus Promineifilaceae bacterium]|nr:ABC transporter permease [Candidatus Promineifilaceae bacterium]
MSNRLRRLVSWEGFLLVLLLVTVFINSSIAPAYLSVENWVNIFQLSIEKIIVALAMTFIIINAEIDLSVASVMGLSAAVLAFLHLAGAPMAGAVIIALLVGLICGLFNGFWISFVGIPSLVVTLATLIMFRGGARILLEDRSIGDFPEWFNRLGQDALLGPFPLGIVLFVLFVVLVVIVLQYSGFGRYVYVIGNSSNVARYSGIKVRRVKILLFTLSGFVAAVAGVLFAARLGAVRGDTALGFELDIITMVLLGGVSIFGGSGSIYGVLLSILIVLNLRNGMSLVNLTGHLQTGVIGILLILSVLIPNIAGYARRAWEKRRYAQQIRETAV